jgi:hypothetical protein
MKTHTRIRRLRRTALVGTTVVLALSCSALAASYTPGVYRSGSQSGFKSPGIRIDIRSGSFNLERILAPETCTASGHPTVHDFGGFQQGSQATLAGPINSYGQFSGRWTGPNTPNFHNSHVTISGQISGSTLTVHGSGHYLYNPDPASTNPQLSYWQQCVWSATFHPTHS